MRSKNYVTVLIILVILLIALGALNYYVVQPALTPKFQAISPPPQASVQNQRANRRAEKSRGKVQKIVETTMEKIRGMFPKKDFSEKFEPRQVTRNPFFWPYEAITPDQMLSEYEKSLKDTEQASELGTRLKMVIMGENRKVALINDQILFEGSMYGADTVQNIYEKEVVLNGPSGETRLMMAQAIPYQPIMGEEKTEAAAQTIKPAHEESVDSLINKLKPFLEKGQQEKLEKVLKTQ